MFPNVQDIYNKNQYISNFWQWDTRIVKFYFFCITLAHLFFFKPQTVSIMTLIPFDTGQGGWQTEDPQQHFTSLFRSRLKKLTTTINSNNTHSGDKRSSLSEADPATSKNQRVIRSVTRCY